MQSSLGLMLLELGSSLQVRSFDITDFEIFYIKISVLPFMGMIAKPIAGWIADNFSKQKLVFLISILLTGFGYFALQLVSGLDPDNSSVLLCSNPQSILKVLQVPDLPFDHPLDLQV